MVCRIQAEARFSQEKLGECQVLAAEHITVLQTRRGKVCCAKLGRGEASAHLCGTTAQFIRLPRELYGLREKRQAKHLQKSSVIHRQAILDYLVAKRQKTPGVDFSVLAQGKVR